MLLYGVHEKFTSCMNYGYITGQSGQNFILSYV